jgi:paraquat-inducible protein B
MTDNNDERLPNAYITRKKGISAIWIVPIIALLFGAWLIMKAVSERGTFITVKFDNASGIVVGKTEVRYKGLPTGIVTGLEVSEDLQSVIVEIEMVAKAKNMLTDKTLFWAVTADISFQGISGLETILSGNYINVQPDFEGKGNARKEFIALSEPPILSETTPGLHINLQADKLGSLGRNSPVSYKQINVGHVSGYHFDNQTNKVNIKVFIEPAYAHLVKENSHFWNASGFEVSGSLSAGMQVKTESLASIISGGIAFSDAKFEAELPLAKNGQQYQLFSNFQTAEMGHEIELTLHWNANIEPGASILFQGLKLGYIESFSAIDSKTRKITAVAKINPRAIPYLTSQTQFYVVSPQLSLGGITHLNGLIKGAHLSLRPSLKGQPQHQFNVLNNKPAYSYDEPGLHLVLKASHIESLAVGSGIFYKKQKVGSVQAISNQNASEFDVHIYIQEQYQQLININSHFWHASGIKIKGGLQNFEVQANSLQSILNGGIEFDMPKSKDDLPVNNGDEYTLFNTQESALQRVIFQLNTHSAKDLTTQTRIMYRGEVAGSIHSIKRIKDNVSLTVGLLPDFDFLLKDQSQFWLVKPTISISGLSDTDALFGGTYIAVNAGMGKSKKVFGLSDKPPTKNLNAKGLQLNLHTNNGRAVSPGSPISYQGIAIGQIDNVSLIKTKSGVRIDITIDDEHKHLITPFSRFYNATGISISGSLNNFSVKTESVDTVLRGGISLFNPETLLSDEKVNEGETFTLFDHIQLAKMAGVAIKIYFNDTVGLTENLAIKYQGQSIGMVTQVALDEKGFGAHVYALLNDHGKKFAIEGTQFWLENASMGLTGENNVSAILEGSFIGVIPGNGDQQLAFKAKDITPVLTELPYGLNIKLTADTLGSIRIGNPVLYRQVKVGKVIGVGLSSTANKVNIYINIAKPYDKLISAQSKFWNTSGVKIDAGLFSGLSIDSESIESLLSGGISFATPELKDTKNPVNLEQHYEYRLHDELEEQWLKWAPKILIKQ